MKIGFFDSGLGGLTILQAVVRAMPQYDYIFYGDTEHLPYGDKTEEEIYELTKEAMRYLFLQDAALVIIACNSASAETLRRLQDTFLVEEFSDRRILGVIIPTVETFVESPVTRAALIGTKRTVTSGKYQKECIKLDSLHTLYGISTPGLVPLLEQNALEQAYDMLRDIIETEIVGEYGGIILGCTHYTLLKERIRREYPTKLTVFSQDEIIPEKLALYLSNHPEIKTKLLQSGKRYVHLTAHRHDYKENIGHLLDGMIET